MDKRRRQLDKVYELLQSPNPDGFTRMQIAKCLGIERASVCRRIADLRDSGQVWVIGKGLDPVTGERAEKLTSNRQVALAYEGKPVSRDVKQEQTGKLF